MLFLGGALLGGLVLVLLMPETPLVGAALAVTALSLGYDMTHPLLVDIVTKLGGKRGGQAMGLNVFIIYTAASIAFGLRIPAQSH